MRALDKAAIAYKVVDVQSDPNALEHVRELGLRHAPVVEGAGGPGSRFSPDRIVELAAAAVAPSSSSRGY